MAVLLGVPDREIRSEETTTWQINKIGGEPDWIRAGIDQPTCSMCGKLMVQVVQIYCPLANSQYHRCLHVFVCLAKKCASRSSGWRVYRTQLLDQQSQSQTTKKPTTETWDEGQDDWGEGQDDWGEGQDDWGEEQDMIGGTDLVGGDRLNAEKRDATENKHTLISEPIATSISAAAAVDRNSEINAALLKASSAGIDSLAELSLEDSAVSKTDDTIEDDEGKEVEAEDVAMDAGGVERLMGILSTQHAGSDAVPDGELKPTASASLPAFYLNVFEEPSDRDECSDHVTSLLQDYERQEGRRIANLLEDQSMSGKGGGEEKYEKTDVRHGDKTCHKFITKLQLCPQQCIRYKWNGSPLLISQPSGGRVQVDRCQSCGSGRVFELQLVPPLIQLLKYSGQSYPAVEFGTVLIYTCSSSCWRDTDMWKEESVVIQQDPDQHLFR